MSQSRRLWTGAKSIAWPVLGFGLGWSVYGVAHERNWISASIQQKLLLYNLKTQLALQSVLPASLTDKYCVSGDLIRSAIERLELEGASGNGAMDNRMTFEQVLRECRVAEQIEYLEDHIREDVPYFYIADLFHAWANIHARAYMQVDATPQKGTDDVRQTTIANTMTHNKVHDNAKGMTSSGALAASALSVEEVPDVINHDAFDTPVLCSLLWQKVQTNVVPFDVGVRVLSVLAVRNSQNAHRLSQALDVQSILDGYAKYQHSVSERASRIAGGDEVVSPAEVATATLTLLCTLNDDKAGSVQSRLRRWYRWIGGNGGSSALGSAALPIASQLDARTWCASFPVCGGQHGAASALPHGQMLARTRVFEQSMSTMMKCEERDLPT